MADKRVQYTLAFSADTKQAKAQLASLQNQITGLINSAAKSSGTGLMSKELHEASVAAAQLKSQLLSATNATTGKLDLTKFNQSLQASNMKLSDYKDALLTLGPSGAQVFANLATSVTQAEIPMIRLSDTVRDLGKTLSNTVKWQISSSAVHGFMGAIQGAYGYAQDLNKSLNDIRIVTNKSTDDMAKFAKKANDAAKALSTTTTKYTDAALIYYQQGLTDDEVIARTNTTTKMANVTGESASDVSSYMTAIWNNFAKGSDNLEYFADVITALGAATAASSEEIAGGLEKFAAVGETVGLSYEYATAALTTIIDKTRQSEDVVGTALKTIFARIQGLQQGDTAEDGVTLNKYSKALENVGISIMDSNGELKKMDAILDEMGSKWETLSKAEQVALAQTVGGTRQYTQLIALMENWGAMQKNLNTAYTSGGSLEEQSKIYEESWEAASKRVKASLEGIYDQLLNDEFFIDLNNALSKMLDMFSVLIDSLGGVKGLFFILGSLGLKVFKTQIGDSIIGLRNTFLGFTKEGRAQLQKLREDANMALRSMYTDMETTHGKLVGSAYETQANAQQDFLNITKELNDEQRKTAQILLDQHSALVNNVVEQGKITEEIEEQVNIEMRRAQKDMTSNDKKALGKYKGIREQQYNLEGLYQNSFEQVSFKNDNEKIKQAHALLTALKEEYKTTEERINLFGKAGEKAFEKLEQAIQTGDPKKVEDAITGIADAIEKLNEKAERAKDSVKGTIPPELDQNIMNLGRNTGELTAKLLKLRINGDNLKVSFKKLATTVQTTSQHMINLAQHTASVFGGLSALGSLKDTWSEESDASMFERMSSSVMTLSYALPSLKSGLEGGYKSIIKWGEAAGAAKTATTAAGEATATFGGSIVAIGKSMIGALAAAAPYILAIGAIVGILAAAYWEYTKDARALEEANENLEKQKKILNDTTAAWNELTQSIENYEKSQEAINKLTEGTTEWKNAIQDANAEVLNLIDKYPELAEQVENINGQLVFKEEGLNLWKERKREELNFAQRGTYAAQVNANIAENKSLKTDTRRDIKYWDFSNPENPQNKEISESDLNNVLKALDKEGNSIFKTVDDLMKATGISNREVAQALYDNKASILKLDATIDANTKTNKLLQQEIAKSFLDDHGGDEFSNSAYSNEIAAKYGEVTGQDSQGYKDAKSKVDQMWDSDMHNAYAQKMGWNVTSIDNQWGKATYHLADGTKYTVNDDVARNHLASEYSMEGNVTQLSAITETISKITDLVANPDAQKALVGIYSGTGDLSNLSAEGYAALKNVDPALLEKYLGDKYEEYKKQYADYDVVAAEEKIEQEYQAKKTTEANQIVSSEELDPTLVDAYAKSLEENNEQLKEQEGLSKLIAAQNMRMNKGLDELQENYEENAKAIKNGNKNSAEYIKAMVSMKEAVGDVLNIDADSMSDKFIETHLSKIKEAANGSVEAIEELRVAAAKDIVANVEIDADAEITKEKFVEQMNSLTDQMTQFAKDNEFKMGATLDTTDFINSLNEMITKSGMSAKEVGNYLKAMGYDAEYSETTKEVESEMQVPETTYKFKGFSLVPETEIKTIKYKRIERIPSVKAITYTGSAGGGIDFSNTTKGGATTSKSSGGSKREAKDVERYHTVNKELESLRKQLESIGKAKDNAFNEKDRLKAMEKEIALYDDIIAKEKEKLALIEKDLTQDKKKLENLGAQINSETGAVLNYEALMNQWNSEYLSGKIDEETFEARMKILEQWEETWATWEDQVATVAENSAAKISAELANIELKAEIKLKFNDQELEYLDYLLSRIEDKSFSAAEKMALLGDQTKTTLDKYDVNVEKLYDLMKQSGLTLDEAIAVMMGTASKDILDKLNDEQEEAFLKLGKDFMTIAKELDNLKQETSQGLIDAIQEGIDAFDEIGEKIDHVTGTLEHYKNIVDIIGQDTLGVNSEEMLDLMQTTVDSSVASLANAQETLNYLQAQRQAIENADLPEDEKNKQLKDIDAKIRQAQSSVQSGLEGVLNTIVEQFSTSLELATKEFEKSMSGAFGSLEKLQEAFDRQKEIDDLYVDDYKKIYELTKLTRDINKSIDETDNIKAKQALRDLQKEINDLQKDGTKLSEYDIEMLNKKYELRLAEIALEDAQNAKSQVRMTRDSEGNWSYTYTADENSIAEAEQNYEDKLYAAQEANQEYIKNLQDQIISSYAAMMQAIKQLGPDATQEEINAIRAHYEAIMEAQTQQMENAMSDSNEILGFMKSETEGWINSFDETTLSALTGYQTMEEYQNAFGAATTKMMSDIAAAMTTYQTNIKTAMDTCGLSVEDFGKRLETVLNGEGGIKDQIDGLETETTNLVDTVSNNVSTALDSLAGFYSTYSEKVALATAETWGLKEAIQALIDAEPEEPQEEPKPEQESKPEQPTGPTWSRVKSAYNKIHTGAWGTGAKRYSDGKADGYTEAEIKMAQKLINLVYGGMSMEAAKTKLGFFTGGYTGEWGASGKLAFLHEKELVLNADDTQNMLKSIEMVRAIAQTIDLNSGSTLGWGGLSSMGVGNGKSEIVQDITINAEFPNATDQNEIKAAFDSLFIRASQYANRK